MEFGFLLLLTLLPAAFWLWFFIRRDRHPEPAWLLVRTFAYGAVAWGLAAAMELSIHDLPQPFVVLILVALLEEGAKFLAASTAVRERDFDEPMDGLVYAVTAALGFATVESVTYGFGYGAGVAAWHGLVTTLAHALFSAPVGYALALSRFVPGRWWRTRGITVSVILHVLFNGLLTGSVGWGSLVALALLLGVMYVIADHLYTRLDPHVQRRAFPSGRQRRQG